MFNGDADMKRQVLHLWDQLYHTWFGKVSI